MILRVRRRAVVAVIGAGDAAGAALGVAEAVGAGVIERGWRLVTGGLGGVMEAASRGARGAAGYAEGSIVGILPGSDPSAANPYVDVVIPTGMGYARNTLVVSMADAVVAVGGGAGTLTEMAMAWQMRRFVIGVDVDGWSKELAGRAIDQRRGDVVIRAADAGEALGHLEARLPRAVTRSSGRRAGC